MQPEPKILIANRGEIACRIVRTCRRLGVATVAVYSEADQDALHVELCDDAVCIGPASVRESYLNADAILAAAKATEAVAIHPGYGFFSENSAFARRVMDAGLVWIGPAPEIIASMGDKAAARVIAGKAGLPLLPASGRYLPGQTNDLLATAADVGFPLLVKAAAGGGGIGMRRVDKPDDVEAVVAATQAMAGKLFGDPGVYLERLVGQARHVEVQIFGFGDGTAVHLHDRDCSVQRRFQKIVEEAPAPGLPDDLRDRLRSAAISLASQQSYAGAGTIEFIYDTESEQAYFLEMNTRIQVEHPVTEMITCIDLVEWQIKQAFGRLSPVPQEDIHTRGHAMEARLYAERPQKNFLPAPGRIESLIWPESHAGLRVDAGVRSGDMVTPHYDPMIGKLIAHGGDRNQALARLLAGLDALSLDGLCSNREFLSMLLRHKAFSEATLSTQLVAELMGDNGAAGGS